MSASDHWHKRFTLNNLGHRLLTMPLLVVLLPFVLGIVMAEQVAIPLSITLSFIVALFAATWLLRRRTIAILYAMMAMLFVGYTLCELHTKSPETPLERNIELVVEVESAPAQRDGYRVAEGRITAWCDDDTWHTSNDRVQLWLRNEAIDVGQRVQLHSKVVECMSRYESYNDLLHRRGLVGGVSITNYNVIGTEESDNLSLQNRAIKRLDSYPSSNDDSHATVTAMAAGSRHNISSDLREAYSTTGLSHLMAVSGLHLGIVLIIINILLAPLSLLHHGHRVRTPIVIAALWLFAIASGASPSVLRAAVMFSMVQIAWSTSSRYNTANILVLTIMLMLAYRPNYLYDISFQLSALAVMGIALWAIPLMRNVTHDCTLIKYLLHTIIVGVVATLWTLPVVSHTFGNIPIIGVIITPIAMISAYVILGCGIFTLLLPTPLGAPFAWVADKTALLQNEFIAASAMPEWTSIEYRMEGTHIALCYAIFIAITVVIWSYERKKVITLPKYDNI